MVSQNETLVKSAHLTVSERMRLAQRVACGEMIRLGHGLYRPANMQCAFEDFVGAVYKRPSAVICLLSALQFHEITTQMPQHVWIALPPTASRPRDSHLKCVVLTGESYTCGQEEHLIAGEHVRVYSVAKTIVDCFKFRNKIGLDVALEALRLALQRKKVTSNEILQVASRCRMKNVITPYLEMYYA